MIVQVIGNYNNGDLCSMDFFVKLSKYVELFHVDGVCAKQGLVTVNATVYSRSTIIFKSFLADTVIE